MKIKIDLDVGSEKLRRLFGMPDVQAFQEERMGGVREQMDAGVEGYDPQTLMRPFMGNAFASMAVFRTMMSGMAGGTGKKAVD